MKLEQFVPGVVFQARDGTICVVCDAAQVRHAIQKTKRKGAPVLEFATGKLHFIRKSRLQSDLSPIEEGSIVTAPVYGMWMIRRKDITLKEYCGYEKVGFVISTSVDNIHAYLFRFGSATNPNWIKNCKVLT